MRAKGISLALVFVPVASYAYEIVLEGVEVRAKREILTQQEVRESFAKDPGEALSRLEGIWKLRKGGIANDIVLRGFKGSNLNVLFDGARIYNACPNRMDPPIFHIDFAEVESIEVIKGPFDIRRYGSVGGTINVKTVKPKDRFSAKLNLNTGSFSYFNPSANLSYGKGGFYVQAGYSYRYSKPYRTGEGKRFTEYPTGSNAYKSSEVDASAFNIGTFWTKLSFTRDKDTYLGLSYTAQRARDVLYPYLSMDAPEDNADRLNLTFKKGKLKIDTYYSYVYHLMNNLKRENPMFMETKATSKTYGTTFEYRWNELSIGIEAFVWNWRSETYLGSASQWTIPDVDLKNAGLFMEYEKKLSEKVRLVVGSRLDVTETRASREKANTDLYYAYHLTRDTTQTDTYPSGNLQLFYNINESIELFVGLGHSVRVPDAQERYFALDRPSSKPDWVGNPLLNPVKNTELDTGIKWKHSRASGEVSFFFSYVRDFITLYRQDKLVDLVSGNTAMSYTNTDARLYGGEVNVVLALTDLLFLEGGLSYVRGNKDTDPAKNIRDRDIAEIPPLKGRFALRYDTGIYFGQLELLAQATQDKVDSDLNESKTPGWAIVNLKMGLEKKGLRVYAGVENLFNKFYYEHLSYLRNPFSTGSKVPEPGRSLYINVAYVF